MAPIETFARSETRVISRRRLLQTLAATVAATQLAALGDAVTASANATVATVQSSPAYDSIVGLL